MLSTAPLDQIDANDLAKLAVARSRVCDGFRRHEITVRTRNVPAAAVYRLAESTCHVWPRPSPLQQLRHFAPVCRLVHSSARPSTDVARDAHDPFSATVADGVATDQPA